MTTTYFDKLIDVTFYDSAGNVLGVLETPRSGRKPEITVSGTLLAGNQSIQTNVEITNLNTDFPVSEVTWLEVVMGYANWSVTDYRTLLLKVFYVDQTETPPDKKHSFVCIEAGQDPDIVFQRVSTHREAGTSLSTIMRDIVTLYNDAVTTPSTKVMEPKLRLSGIVLNVPDYVTAAPVTIAGSSLWALMRTVELEFIMDRTIAVDGKFSTVPARTNSLYLSISGDKLVAEASAVNTEDRLASANEYTLDYVVKATRTGPIYTITSLFDPRIRVGDKVRFPVSALVTKRVGTGVIGIPVDPEGYVPVYASVQIVFAFSTGKTNSMIIDKAIEASVAGTKGVSFE